MNHIPVHKLSEFIDGILDTREKDAILTHIAECPECHKNLMQLKKMLAMLSCLKAVSMPSTFTTTTMEKVKRQYFQKRFYRSIRGSVIAAVVLVAIITMLPNSIKHDQFTNQVVHKKDTSPRLDCIIPTNMDLNTAMMVIQQYNTKVLDYSNSYIIVESDVKSFSSIQQIINNYDSYRPNAIANVGINHITKINNKFPQLTHANKKKYVFRLQLR
ncbi:MAG: zf-HC2 domain-containing protein [Spirochaetes bacterium]|nr:zf-HC2 domain-containing protein [Spirochaetota bacterium]